MVLQHRALSGKDSGREDKDLAMTISLISYRLWRLPYEEIKKAYQGYVYAINMNSIKQSQTMFARIAKDGLSARQRAQALAAAEHVLQHHTWRHRLKQLTEMAA